ncbi:uncharacterized protein LOC109821534 [Asparagus officinalis]|uniref:uncharacterized protein LOC109821534 n=1 Tax=Asparagus officinalis TaxID=4686 RepID=UPI00098E5782|nr:uncharacterized protein LOC109821534 [Asparagus officinalis]
MGLKTLGAYLQIRPKNWGGVHIAFHCRFPMSPRHHRSSGSYPHSQHSEEEVPTTSFPADFSFRVEFPAGSLPAHANAGCSREVFSSTSIGQVISPFPQFDQDRSDDSCRLVREGGRHCLRQLITDATFTADSTSTQALQKPSFLFGDHVEDPAILTLGEEHWLTLDGGALLYIPSIPRQYSFTHLRRQAVRRQMSWDLTKDAERVPCGYTSHSKTPGSGGYHHIRGLCPGITGLDTAPPGETSAAASTVGNRLALLGRRLPPPEPRCYGWASSLAKGWWARMTDFVLARWERDLKSSGLYAPIRATMYGIPVSCRHFLALLETYMPDSNTFLTSGGDSSAPIHELDVLTPSAVNELLEKAETRERQAHMFLAGLCPSLRRYLVCRRFYSVREVANAATSQENESAMFQKDKEGNTKDKGKNKRLFLGPQQQQQQQQSPYRRGPQYNQRAPQ